jgi:GAF domain-containing protein
MNPPSAPVGNPSYPRVVGFDMPPEGSTGLSSETHALIALLDSVPRKEWVTIFAREADAFKGAAGISDVRVIGKTITFLGSAEKLRVLPPRIHAFVYRVARQCLQDRIFQLADPALVPMPSAKPDPALVRDLESVAHIHGIPTILEAVVNTTGMRFAAVARVTDERWTACAVYDLIDFGLKPGQDLLLESTICNEIRQHGSLVAFDQASAHAVFSTHPTPAMYGFESYISIPILRQDGSFFGTLCALDPEPSKLDSIAIETLRMFARMIGMELVPQHAD